jgi:hypothetical protein
LDHVHICISIPPKYAVSNVVGYIKGKIAISIARGAGDTVCRRSPQYPADGEWIPSILEPHESSKGSRKNLGRLIPKIYEVDPLTGPRCSGEMKAISVIEDEEIIQEILQRWTGPQAPTPPPSSPCLRAVLLAGPISGYMSTPDQAFAVLLFLYREVLK